MASISDPWTLTLPGANTLSNDSLNGSLFLPASQRNAELSQNNAGDLPVSWRRGSETTTSRPPPKRRASSSVSMSHSPPGDKQRADLSDDDEEDIAVNEGGENGDGGEPARKPKKTRGSRACTICRRLKMRCVAVEGQAGPPCKRCKSGGHECIFEESLRGRRTNRKRDEMAKSLKKMEATLGTVLQSIGRYGLLADPAGELVHPGVLVPPSSSTVSPPSLGTSAPLPPASASPASSNGMELKDLKEVKDLKDFKSDDVLFPSEVGFTPPVGLGVPGTTHQISTDPTPRLHSLPSDSLNPLGLLVEASLQNSTKGPVTLREVLNSSNGDLDVPENADNASSQPKRGIANFKYFQPGPLNIIPLRKIVIEHRMPPILLTEKIITPEEVTELFDLYFAKCHLAVPILDPLLHTPSATTTRSPFLFTTICTVASRYYTKRTDDLYRKCLRFAKASAFDVLARGFKSPEICQAFLLLVNWNQPSERYEEERGYQFSGIAIRMAQDLNLHRKTPGVLPENVTDEHKALYEREILNRERVWLFCFICDRAIACQMGKPHSIPKEDFIIRNSKRWFMQPESQATDAGLSMLVELHRIVTRILETLYSDTRSTSGLNLNLDYPVMVQAFLNQINTWLEDWQVICPTQEGDPDTIIRTSMRYFYHSYYRLFVLSFAVQHAIGSPDAEIDLPKYCASAFDAAGNMITIVRDVLAPHGFFRHSPDSTFVFVSYACCFLLKLMNPTFSSYVNSEKAMQFVLDGAQVLEDIAVDDTHTPALYASFLRALLASRRSDALAADHSSSFVNNPTLPSGAHMTDVASIESLFGGLEENIDLSSLTAQGLESFESMDEMIKDGFWDNMLMPGFGGPLGGLMGGAGVFSTPADPWAFTPIPSRAGSPAPFTGSDAFNF